MSEIDETAKMTERRKYCCSNRAPIEAFHCGSLDLIISLAGFITTIVYTYFYTSKFDSLQTSTFGTIKRFILLKTSAQTWILIWFFAITVVKTCHSTILLLGSLWQNSVLLKIWILLCIPIGLGASGTAFFLAYFAHEKLLFGFLALFYFLFQIYTSWIVREYAAELRSVSTSESQMQFQLQSASIETIEENSQQKY